MIGLLFNFTLFAQMTVWNDFTFIVLDVDDYNERINKSQYKWNDIYYVVDIEGKVISDEILRTYLFSYM